MNKVPVQPKSHSEMVREYPLSGLVEGWFFRQREVSNGCYLVEGSDAYGREVSRQAGGDPDAALAECVEFARATSNELKTNTGS